MSLEKKLDAYWVNLGLVDYKQVQDLQERLAELRKKNLIPDIILAFQTHPTITFGVDNPNNTFSKEFLEEVEKETGDKNTDSALKVLNSKGIGFYETPRGGGISYIGPGQLIFYPIVDYEKVTGRKFGIGDYKIKIYRVLFNTLKNLGVEGINIADHKKISTRKERRDAWINENGRSLKMGSKGIRTERNVSLYGFSLYVDKEGTDNFWMINPCGYDHEEVGVVSLEEFFGKKVNHSEVYEEVKRNILEQFGYEHIQDIREEKLISMVGEVPYAKAQHG